MTAAAAAAAYLVTPVYRASTVLIPANHGPAGLEGSVAAALGQLGGLASLAGVNLANETAVVNEALAVLRSRHFTERFLVESRILPELYPELWDAESQDWKVPRESQPTVARGYRVFDEDIRSIVQDRRTGLVVINIDWHDREQAATWANDLVERLNAEMRRRAIAQADASLNFLERELVRTREVRVRDAIGRLLEAQIQQRMLANVSPEFAFRVVDRALVPDSEDIFYPRRIIWVAIGAGGGAGAGLLVVLILQLFKLQQPATEQA